MGPNQDIIEEEAQLVEVEKTNSKEVINSKHPQENGIIPYTVAGSNDFSSSLILPAGHLATVDHYCKMPDHLNNFVVKATNWYELCLLRSQAQSYFPLEYPLSNIAFQLTFPKYIPMSSDLSLVGQAVPSIPLLPSSLRIEEGFELIGSLPQDQRVNSIIKSPITDQNKVQQYSSNDVPLSEYVPSFSGTDTINISISAQTGLLKPVSRSINCEKQKCKVEPILRQSNTFENNLVSSFLNDKSVRSRIQNLPEHIQKFNMDAESSFDFSIEAEQMVSSICNFSPPKVCTKNELLYSKQCNSESVQSEQGSSVSKKADRNLFLPAVEDTSFINNVKHNISEDWSRNVTKHNMCQIFPDESNEEKIVNQNRGIQECFNCTNFGNNNGLKINQETLLFRATALRGCYDIENILKTLKLECPEVQEKCNSVKEAIFAAIKDVKGVDTFLSDFSLSFLRIVKSWISLNSHFENLLKNIDPEITDHFMHWQSVTRMFMENILTCLKIVNQSHSLNPPDANSSLNSKNKMIPLHNPYCNFSSSCWNPLTSSDVMAPKLDGKNVDLKTNFNFCTRKQQMKMTETNNSFKEMFSKSDTVKNVSQTNWNEMQLPKLNFSAGSETQPFCQTKVVNMNPVSKLQVNWTSSAPKYIPEHNTTPLFGCGDELYKNNLDSVSKNVTNLVGPSFFSKKKDDYSFNDQLASENILSNTPLLNVKNPFYNTSFPGFCNTPVSNLKNPSYNPLTQRSEPFEFHSNYTKDQNTNIFTANSTTINQPNPFNMFSLPYYNPPLGIVGNSPSLMHYNQLPMKNPIQCTDNDSDSNTSYMRPGCYEPPQKPGGCLKPLNFNFPVEDTPVIGIPFIYRNHCNKSQSASTTQQPPKTQDVNTDVSKLTSNKADDTWKAALASAESLCETLMMKPEETLFTTNKFKINLDSDDGHSLSLETTEAGFKIHDWSINAFNESTLQNDTNDASLDKNKSFMTNLSTIERNSDSDESELSFFELKEMKCTDPDLLYSCLNLKEGLVKSVGLESQIEDVPTLNKQEKYNMQVGSNHEKQFKIAKKGLVEDYSTSQTSFDLCGTKQRRCINRQTCNKLQDILDNIWKTDLLKLLKNINNSSQELQNIEVKIKCPAFLQHVTNRLQNRGYETTDQAFSDFQQFFHNIRSTNKDDEAIVLITNKLEKIYNKLVEKHFGIEETFDKKQCSFGPIGSIPGVKYRKQKKAYRKP